MLDLLPSLDKTTTLVSQRSLARSRRSSYQKISGQSEKQSEEWEDFPFGQPDYNPFVEWGEHYYSIFSRDLWASESTFVLQDLNGDQVTERRISGSDSVEQILQEDDPDIRIFYCDSKLCDDLVTRASFAVADLKKIFCRYNFSIVFLDRFIGRNRCTTGSRKLYDTVDPSRLIGYDLWYDLPCRIYGAEHEYQWHFILFTVYVHYDVVNNKAVLFYIHRLGSEHPSAAEWSSRKLKDRVRTSLEHAATSSAHLNALRNCPFLIQLPTITSATIFWTETLHKERLSMWKKEEEGTKDLSTVDTSKLHDILRYVHSYMANLQIVLETLNFVKAEHEWYLQNLDNTNHYRESPWSSTMRDGIEAQVFQIKVIIIWTTEVLKRTRILIDL
ncbi:hypothetical protein C1H76_6043 [Elsinoe australis]|uniref:Uncharacterized protein n=1 Tax=Elsinoe australis TaxID=40998 RepID=A0A4U7B2J7_9PEZI|nr:hypothetical protein C1H76_6043 [Elsinoe australis]